MEPFTWTLHQTPDKEKRQHWHVEINRSLACEQQHRTSRWEVPSFKSPLTCLSLHLVLGQNTRICIQQHQPPHDPWKRLSPFLIGTGRRGIQVEVCRPTNCFLALYETAVASREKNFKWKIFFKNSFFFFFGFPTFQLCKFEFHKHLGTFALLLRIPTLLISFLKFV